MGVVSYKRGRKLICNVIFSTQQCFEGASELPTMSYNFKPISKLEEIPKDSIVGQLLERGERGKGEGRGRGGEGEGVVGRRRDSCTANVFM